MKRLCYGLGLCLLLSCQAAGPAAAEAAIVETLQAETRYFCARNLAQWQAQWSQQPFVAKMYARDGQIEWFDGWEAIHRFTVAHIAAHPEPLPLPATDPQYEVHLFAETAWVFFAKTVDGKTVRETRFMVKEKGKWKIARMQTLYGVAE